MKYEGEIIRNEHREDAIRNWIREDILLVGYAKHNGWTVDLKGDELDSEGYLPVYSIGRNRHFACRGDTYVFRKGNVAVWYTTWRTEKSEEGWNREVKGDFAKDVKRFATLKEALG